MRPYVTSWKVAVSRPEELIEFFSIYLILPALLGPEIYSPSNRNEYEKQKKKLFWGLEIGWRVRLTSLPYLSRLSRQFGILSISQPYRSARPVTGIDLLYYYYYWLLYIRFSVFGRFFSSLILHVVGRSPRKGDQPVAKPLSTHRTTQTD
jgi:hypothetical protein